MSGKFTEKDFTVENYEEFYSDHHFVPFPDEDAVNMSEYLPRVGWAVDVADEINARSVLDLGCLEGFTALTLANNVASVKEAVGVDLSRDGIELGKQRATRFDLPVDFYQMSVEDYLKKCVKEGKKFDLICAFELMEHVKDPALVFKLIDQVKSDGGTVLISTPDFEAPTYGKDDEKNKCHIRLYTTADADYAATNKYGHVRQATSLSKAIGKERIKDMEVINELINLRYQ
jgi:2-polyprenyl-3-methyl-5-hydroxy-6-metoxy-1,4-benzoquinol methylase